MSYQPASGLYTLQTLHLHLYVRIAKHVELAVWEIYTESRISVPDMDPRTSLIARRSG
jgi:hypothetical protein